MKIMFCALMLLASAIAHAQPGSVRINEIMYDDTAGIDVEWVELYNTLNVPVDVSHWVLTDGNTWPVPTSEGAIQISAGVTIPPLGYQVISKQSLIGVPGLVCAEIDPSWLLHDTGDNLALYDGVGFSANLIDGTIAPLQNFPDLCGLNSGNSLEKCNQAAPWSTDPSQWHESTHLYSTSGRYRHCTPGLPNSACASLCGGSLQAPPMLTIPHTAVGSSNVINFPIMNDGVQTICIDSIRTNGNVFTTNVPPVLLEPGGVFDVQVMFAPLYEFDFDGVVTIYHAQADTPKTVVHINALACTPVVSPPPPILHSAGSPNHLYYVIPWDPQNSERTKYAVEVSPDAFQTSWFIEPIPSNPGPQTVYFLGKDWAQRGTGVISGLNPGVNHQVRLWARDCFGNEMVGTFAELSTEPAIQFSADPRLTVQVIHPDSLRLRWIPAITEALGRSVQFLSWGIYYGETPDNINELIAVSNDSVFDIGGVDSLEKGFFDVRVISDRILAEPKPHFVWPPPGATVSGMNSILLHDMLHRAHWDSFTVVLDPETDSTLIGSSWSTPWTEGGRIGFPFDFSTINPGPHVLRATVVDPSGGSFQTDSPLLCTPLFQRNFFTQWQNILHAYLLDTVGVTWQSPHNPLGIVWHTSKGQHYGSPATIEYEPYQPGDSLIMIKILVPTAQKYLSDSKYDFEDGSQQYIAVEQDSTPRVPRENIACCCDGLIIRTTGNDEGNYGEGDGAAPLGAIVTCVNGEYFVGFAFEVELTLKYVKADNPGECSFGQDCKRTEITEIGQCDPGWKPAKRPGTPTYKKHKGSQYPYDGAMRGNDDYRRNYHGETLDLSEQVKGKIRWWDRPWSSGTIPEGVSIRLKRDASFFARADPECPNGTWNCCRMWEIHWDVVFCEDCSIIQLTPPELTNEQSPLECPGLAGD